MTPFDIKTKDLPNGCTVRVEWHYDSHHGAPWEESDGHGPVRTVRDVRCKRPGELVLHEDDRGHGGCLYDFAEACRMARRDGWGYAAHRATFPSARAYAAAAARNDFDFLRRWCNDDWWWCGYVVSFFGPDGEPAFEGEMPHDSLWGIDSDSIDQFTEEAFASAEEWLTRELANAHDAACRDLVTV